MSAGTITPGILVMGLHAYELGPCEYGITPNGEKYAVTPNGLLCSLRRHAVAEELDGTFTVEPSIAVSDGALSWHGYLERGRWREV